MTLEDSLTGIRGVGFDLDGTLIDSTEGVVAACLAAFDEFGGPRPAVEEIVRTISLPLEEQLQELMTGDVTRHAEAYRRHYHRLALDMTALFPGVRESLDRLAGAGVPMAVITSKRRDAAERLLMHLGVWEYFGFCIGPDDVARPKPDPEGILNAAKRLDIAPARFAYIGDSEYDMRAAVAAGARGLGVLTGSGGREALLGWGARAVFPTAGDAVSAVLDEVTAKDQ